MINTKALREKILDLAMRGKLVVPDLTKEKTDIFETEKQGYLPQNWVLTSLSNVATLLNGRAYKKNELLSNERLTPVLRVGNLFTNSQWYYSDLNLDSNKYIDNGDLIYAWSASFGPRIWNGGKAIYHYHIWKISLRFEESKKFMYYFLLDNAKKVKKNTTGSTMVHITKRKMEQMKVPFPPLEEQKRIVAKIEELFALIDIIESNQLEFKQLAEQLDKKVLDLAMRGKLVPQNPTDEPASVLLDEIKEEKEQLIKDKKVKKENPLPEISKEEIPYEIPDSWEWGNLQLIADYIQRGKSPKYSNIERYPVISQKCIQWTGINMSVVRFIEPSSIEKYDDNRIVKNNDILWNSTGIGTVGRVGIVKQDNIDSYEKVVVDSHVTLVRTNKLINSKYVF
ncbi:restriction endonuclease subunit S, partial [Enterococcus faecium]|nr:restriction endonuclease subunit S [Enterococcus faecium]